MRTADTIRPPGDKSITHRALLIAGLMRSRVELRSALNSADTDSTVRVLRQLGVDITPLCHEGPVHIVGGSWSSPAETLYCGNSGTTARLLLGALAGRRVEARLDGDASLRNRPMRRVTAPLTKMGARIREERGDALPLSITGGGLRPIRYEGEVSSAQVKTALMLAGLTGQVRVTVVEPAKSRDHTERLLRFIGVDVRTDGLEVELVEQEDILRTKESFDLTVPGDPSSAAFLIAAATIAGQREVRFERVCVNPTRVGFLDVMRRMGAQVRLEQEAMSGGEPVADIVASPASLRGTEVHAAEVPSLIDEVPVLSVLAARAFGETTFRSVGELRVKESNRLDSIAANLRNIGVRAEVSGGDLHIDGTDAPLRGRVQTGGDHRISMAFSVLATAPRVNLDVSENASVGVSYPAFFDDLLAVGGQ